MRLYQAAFLLCCITRAVPAHAAETLFVHASALNLRVKPSATSKARAQVPIGMACDVITRLKDGWAELKCPQGRGFAKLELLGSKAPEHGVYFKDGTNAARPLSERINLLQRALALKPDDSATQSAFRETFWDAEFDRLSRARTAKDTLKNPVLFKQPNNCGDVMAPCVRAALEQGLESAWADVQVRGLDVVHAMLYPDGLFRVRSGGLGLNAFDVTVELESLTVPSPPTLKALGANKPVDVCVPKAQQEGDGPGVMCGYEYDQNCSPDRCWETLQGCREESAVGCQACKLDCSGGCAGCRMKCVSGDRKACVQKCVAQLDACANTCQDQYTSGESSCQQSYKPCAAKQQAYWDQNCKAGCDAIHACVDEKTAGGGNSDYDATVGVCVKKLGKKLPDDCREDCLFQFQ